MTMLCPSVVDIRWPRMRAIVSVGPPAAKGTVTVIGRDGYGCANVLEPVSDNTQATTRNSNFLDDIFASPSQAETQSAVFHKLRRRHPIGPNGCLIEATRRSLH